MDLGLQGKRAVVQGASSGIGYAIAEALLEEGAQVVICSHHQERIERAAGTLKRGARGIAVDLEKNGGGKEFIEKAVDMLGGVDILVTNTGGPPKGDFCDLSIQDWETGYKRVWQSAVESIHEALISMKKQKFGRILLSTSTAAKEPIPHLTVSTAYRAGLLGLMKALSREVALDGITVNSLMPGFTRTERMEKWSTSLDELAKEVPMQRLADPKELGALAAFLVSDQASYITGQAVACDGGLLQSF